MVQDSLGFVWIGTYGGLVRFDGQQAETVFSGAVIPLIEGRGGLLIGGYEELVFVDPFERSPGAHPLPEVLDASGELVPAILLSLAEDGRGDVWLILRPSSDTEIHYLCRFRQVEGDFVVFGDDGRGPANPTALLVDRNGALWVGTARDGLYRYDPATETVSQVPPGPNRATTDGILALYESPEEPEYVWVSAGSNPFDWQGPGGSVYPLDRETGTLSHEFPGLPSSQARIWAFMEDRSGRLWMGGQGGLFVMEEGASGSSSVSIPGIGTPFVTHLSRAGESHLWLVVGTNEDDRHVLYFDTETRTASKIAVQTGGDSAVRDIAYAFSGPMEGLVGSAAVVEDRYGTLWAPSRGGMLRFVRPSEAVSRLGIRRGESEGINGERVRALHGDERGRLWIGTQGGGVSVYEPDRKRFMYLGHDPRDPTSISDDYVQTMAGSSEDPGRIWIGTGSQSQNDPVEVGALNLFGVSAGRALRFPAPGDDERRRVQAVLEDGSGRVWVATSEGVFRFEEAAGSFVEVRMSTAGSAVGVKVFAEDRGGSVWMGTSTSALMTLAPDGQYLEEVHRFESGHVNALVPGSDGELLVGTDNGVYFFASRGNVVGPFRPGTGGHSLGMVQHMVKDELGGIWIAANTTVGGEGRIYRLDPGSRSVERIADVATAAASIWFRPPAGTKLPNGTLAFGGDGGVVLLDPKALLGADAAPDLALSGLRVRGRSVVSESEGLIEVPIELLRELQLSYDQNDVQFDYVGLQTARVAGLQYAFMLEGYDETWREVGARRTADYYKLDPGVYWFRVRARVGNGPWGAERTLHLRVRPPWWNTPAARVGFGLLALLILAGVHHGLRAQAIRRERERARERELEQAREIEKAYAELKATQQQLVESEKMASLGLLTAGIAHEINNPLNFVSSNIEPLRKDIDDLRSVLQSYEEEAHRLGFADRMGETRQLKEDLDWAFVSDEVDDLLAGIRQGATRTADIVRSLQSFSRLGAVEKLPADIHEGLEVALVILSNELRDRIEVVREYGSIPEVLCFPGELNQAFLHLLTNAVEAIEGRGRIVIKTWREDRVVKISVRDSGHGIPEEIRGRVFDPFFTTKDVGRGAGLGLSTSFGIVKDHGGTIELADGAEGGAEFVVTLPID